MRDILATGRPRRVHSRVSATINGPGTLIVWTDADGTQQTRTWPNALPGHRSPCRPDRDKGVHQHRCSRAHAELVDGYRAWREHEHAQAEQATQQYAAEEADYWRTHTRPTLKAYLLSRKIDRADAA